MKKILFISFVMVLCLAVNSYAYDPPDLLYYRFKDNTPGFTPNWAIPGVGTNPASVLVHTFGPGGQFDSCMIGTGATNSGIPTGWLTDFGSGSFTISMWLNNLPVNTTLYYLFGESTGSFRCFLGGAAGAGNVLFRGTGITDVVISAVAPGPTVVHIVYDSATATVKAYKDGVLSVTVPQTAFNFSTGVGFKVGAYSTSAGLNGLMDEFRAYRRALSDVEIAATWNIELVGGPTQTIYASQWCPTGAYPDLPAATYFQASAWLGDTLYVHTPGTAGAATTTIIRYTEGGSWTTGVPMPSALVGGTLTACNGKLYYMGGGTSTITTGVVATVYCYDPISGAWTTKTSMPAALSSQAAENWGDSVIFVWGGPYTGSGTVLNVHYYRVATDTWGTIPNSIPSGMGRRTFAHGISGNKLFMAGGYNTAFLKTFFIGTIGSDATQITWTQGPDLPIPGTWTGLSRPGGVAYEDMFYVVCGERGGPGGYRDSVDLWHIPSNSWLPPITGKPGGGMSNIFSGCVAKKINDTVKVYLPGGYIGSSSPLFGVIGCGPTITGNKNNLSNIPSEYKLSQNYPNPFNPVTKINFSVPKQGYVTLKVYDLLGREVKTLVNEIKTTGNYVVEFNASNLASGVYFYRLETEGFSDVKRMMLVK